MDRRDPPPAAQAADPTDALLWMLNGHCLQQALHVVAVLGIADWLGAGPRNVESLAAATGTHELSLRRVMSVLASVGVFEASPERTFALTPLGTALREDAPGSVRDRALYYGSQAMWGVWGGLLHSVRTGGVRLRARPWRALLRAPTSPT